MSGQHPVQAELFEAAGDPDNSHVEPAPRPCPTCRSAGRCEGRVPTADGGWVCRAAQAKGLFHDNRKHLWVRLRARPGPER